VAFRVFNNTFPLRLCQQERVGARGRVCGAVLPGVVRAVSVKLRKHLGTSGLSILNPLKMKLKKTVASEDASEAACCGKARRNRGKARRNRGKARERRGKARERRGNVLVLSQENTFWPQANICWNSNNSRRELSIHARVSVSIRGQPRSRWRQLLARSCRLISRQSRVGQTRKRACHRLQRAGISASGEGSINLYPRMQQQAGHIGSTAVCARGRSASSEKGRQRSPEIAEMSLRFPSVAYTIAY